MLIKMVIMFAIFIPQSVIAFNENAEYENKLQKYLDISHNGNVEELRDIAQKIVKDAELKNYIARSILQKMSDICDTVPKKILDHPTQRGLGENVEFHKTVYYQPLVKAIVAVDYKFASRLNSFNRANKTIGHAICTSALGMRLNRGIDHRK